MALNVKRKWEFMAPFQLFITIYLYTALLLMVNVRLLRVFKIIHYDIENAQRG
jgi:hypothetical protein